MMMAQVILALAIVIIVGLWGHLLPEWWKATVVIAMAIDVVYLIWDIHYGER